MTVWTTLAGPVLYAHRGAAHEQPENSLEAFQCALEAGADVLEADVHMTRDGHVVIAHDPSGTRTAGIDAEIRRSTLAEVKGWDLRHGAPWAAAARPVRVPTLDELLKAFPDAALNLDVKQREPEMTGSLARLIGRHGAEERVLLTSFHVATTLRLRRLRYAGPTGLARAEVAAALFLPAPLRRLAARRGQRMQIPLRAGVIALDRAPVVAAAHRLGLFVDYWVVNDVAVAERLLTLGADGIVTDEPRAMAQLFARSAATSAWRERHPAIACGAAPGHGPGASRP